jgi:hypothetical protein
MNQTGTCWGLRPVAAAKYADSGSSRRVLIDHHAAMDRRIGAPATGPGHMD